MTLNSHHTVSSGNMRADTTSEAPLQAYIRKLHEANNRHNTSDEPVRGKDPWIGLLS